jgi:isopentenyl-diphosphate delta-isomerase
MKEVTPIGIRKSDHIRINLEEDVQSGLTSGLEAYHFVHHALPEINLEEVNPGLSLFGKVLAAPLLISSMTGGTDKSLHINQLLARVAQQAHIAMGVGSQRIALEHPDLAHTFKVRQFAPDILLFANLGAVQLNYGYTIDACRQVVEMIEADALILHFNAIQEAIQSGGNTNFSGLIRQVEAVCKALPVPVIAKEVGWGFSEDDINMLVNAGVKAIDTAGAGGTSWSKVEMYRAETEQRRELAAAFSDWGIPTAQVIQNVHQAAPGLSIIASGGLHNGVDIAKCIALGASLGGMAGPFLKSADQSEEETHKLVNLFIDELRICMFATGSKTLRELKDGKLVKK